MIESSVIPSRSIAIAGILAVTAAFIYFLLFAGMAFLDLGAAARGGAPFANWYIAALAGGGVAGSFLAARRFAHAQFPQTLANSFRACGVAAALVLVAQTWWVYLITATMVGLSFGWLAVTLASGLRNVLGTAHLGRYVGIAVGTAYVLSSLLWVFNASPKAQVLIAGFAAVLGSLSASWMWPRTATQSSSPDYAPRISFLWVAMFTALVALDTALSQVVLGNPAIQASGWSGTWQLLGDAALHFGTALLAGFSLDRRWLGRLQVAAFIFIAGACMLVDRSPAGSWWVAALYAPGASIYSVALVYYATRSGRPLLAGWMTAVACWGGSALGLSIAQGANRVPRGLTVGAAVVIAVALCWRAVLRRNTPNAGARYGAGD